MSKLIVILTDHEKIILAKELEKLFVLNGRSITPEAKATFIEKMVEVGLPFGTYLNGMRTLMLEDVSRITLGGILKAARKLIEETPLDSIECEHCGRSGTIIMIDADGYERAIACNCTNGESFKRINECPRLNGEDSQMNGSRLLKMRWPVSQEKGRFHVA